MHVHRPKPLHSVREMLTEIAVIVVGIVIALSGEQFVDWLHWRSVTAQTRQALNRELAEDLASVQVRIDQGPCIARRLGELRSAFALHAQAKPVVLKAPFGQPQFPHIDTSVWETALADQGAAHLPIDIRLSYARLYDAMYWFRDNTSEESDAWGRLSQFDDQSEMAEQDWATMRQWAAQARAVAEKVDANTLPFTRNGTTSRPYFDAAAALGVRAATFQFVPASEASRAAFCRPMI